MKYQAKCLRISNHATACQLVNTLVEKFHPDLKRLTAGRYALYEYNTTNGERRLAANEAPLMVQLSRAYEDQEIRFILRDETKPMPTTIQQRAFENQPGSLQNGGFKLTSDQKLNGSNSLTRRWASGSRKKKKKNSKDLAGDPPVNSADQPIPDSTFTRTLSNPDEVLRRRRQHARAQRRPDEVEHTGSDHRTHPIKIYGSSLNPEIASISLNVTMEDTVERVIRRALEKYQMTDQVNPMELCLVQLNIPPRGEQLPPNMEREVILHHRDSPLAIRSQLEQQYDRIHCLFELRPRTAKNRRPNETPNSAKPQAPLSNRHPTPSTARSHSVEPRMTSLQPSPAGTLHPHLIQILSEQNPSPAPNGMRADLAAIFQQTHMTPIKLGTIDRMIGPPPNILIDKNQYPDIRPVHCTFTMALSGTIDTSKHARPDAAFEPDSQPYSLIVTPSLDGFAKPPGPALVRVNGQRISGPIVVPANGVLQIGKSLFLKFINPPSLVEPLDELVSPGLSRSEIGLQRKTNPGSHDRYGGSRDALGKERSHPPGAPRNVVNGMANSRQQQTKNTMETDLLPLSIVLNEFDLVTKSTFLDRYVALVDQVLSLADDEIDALSSSRGEKKPAPFSLSVSYALYLVYRACCRHAHSMKDFSASEQEHNVSYVTNYIATRVFESVPNFTRDARDPLFSLQTLVFWLANTSELLQFFKRDVNLSSPAYGLRFPGIGAATCSAPPDLQSPVHACRQALHLLADAVDHCFYELRMCMLHVMHPLMQGFLYVGDADLQDDLRLDDKPIHPQHLEPDARSPQPKIQPMMQLFSCLMHQVRRCRVNASLTIQLFAQLFHALNAHIFNTALVHVEAKPRHSRDDTRQWLTRLGAARLNRRMQRLKQWAGRQGLERAAECRLQKCVQACELVMASRSNLDEFYQFCMGLLSLNSLQLEWLLTHLGDPPTVPEDWVDLIVTGAKEVNDRAILDEMENYIQRNNNDLDDTAPELQLGELKELPLPLMLPPDGYASDAILTGTPSGLTEFVRGLCTRGLVHIQRNPTVTGTAEARPWTRYLRLGSQEEEEDPLEDDQPHGSPNVTSDLAKDRPASGSESSPTDSSSSSEFRSIDTGTTSRRTNPHYRPRATTNEVTRPRGGHVKHQSLPDLSKSEFDVLATEANVPVRSITRFYLRKYNDSLGLSIVAAKAVGQSQYGIYVKAIVPGGAADRDGRLDTGDQILAIGTANLIGCAQSDAVATLAKQSRSEEGVQLTVAQGAAKYHRILELIQPNNTADSEENKKTLQNATKTTHTKSHPKEDHTQLASSHGGLRDGQPTNQVKYVSDKRGTEDRAAKATQRLPSAYHGEGKYRPQHSGSLSRSTPSLNLAMVGVDGEGLESLGQPPEQDKQESATTRKPVTKSLKSADRSAAHQAKTRSLDAFEHCGPMDERAHSLDSASLLSNSSASKRPTNDPARRQHRQPDATRNRTSGQRLKEPVARLCSLSDDNDDVSSLESVSSPHTGVSLNDSAVRQVRQTTVEDKHLRHPPPPIAPAQKFKESKTPSTKDRPAADKSIASKGDDASNGRRLGETRELPNTQSESEQQPTANVVQRIQSTVIKSPSLDGQQFDDSSRAKGSRSPMSACDPNYSSPDANRFNTAKDTCVTDHKLGSVVSTDRQGSPVVADLSHFRPTTVGPPAGWEETVSEALRPPPHAVVDIPRWTEEKVPRHAPDSIPDLPALHSDPQRGRTKNGTMETNRFDRGHDPYAIDYSLNPFPSTRYPVDTLSGSRDRGVANSPIPSQAPMPWKPATVTSTKPAPMNERRHSYSQSPWYGSPNPSIPDLNESNLPPPIPTADHPQYHPPKELIPTEWPEESTWHSRAKTGWSKEQQQQQGERSNGRPPSPAPKPQVQNAHAYKHPVQLPTTQRFTPRQTGLVGGTSGAAQRVAQLEAELAMAEARQSKSPRLRPDEVSPEVDRLRVELQFQKRLAERETLLLRHEPLAPDEPPERVDSQTGMHRTHQDRLSLGRPGPTASSFENHVTWEQKRLEAERELEASHRRRLAELEREHQAMLERQAQRARERTDWFEHQPKYRTDNRCFSATDVTSRMKSPSPVNRRAPVDEAAEGYNTHSALDVTGRYGRPRFDQHDDGTGYGPNQANIYGDVDLSRPAFNGLESFRVKKSVSFDKNLETISVYSPQVTPQESFAEGSHSRTGQRLDSKSSAPQLGYSLHPEPVEKPGPRYIPCVPSIYKSDPMEVPGRVDTSSPNPVPNAELLPFKEKMRLFAQKIGEDPPKERSKLSSRQRQLLDDPAIMDCAQKRPFSYTHHIT